MTLLFLNSSHFISYPLSRFLCNVSQVSRRQENSVSPEGVKIVFPFSNPCLLFSLGFLFFFFTDFLQTSRRQDFLVITVSGLAAAAVTNAVVTSVSKGSRNPLSRREIGKKLACNEKKRKRKKKLISRMDPAMTISKGSQLESSFFSPTSLSFSFPA